MKRLTLILFLFSILPLKAQTETFPFPSYDEVIDTFFCTYTVEPYIPSIQIRFEKRPRGWQIRIIDGSLEQKTIKQELFWDRQGGHYKALSLNPLEKPGQNKVYIDNFKNAWDKRFFSFMPYFGYQGWEKDLIRDYADKEDLSDSLSYALGRAYSAYAGNLLSGVKNHPDRFELAEGKNCLSPTQLETYRKYSHNAIKYFEKVAELNPDFETIVGSIIIKAANAYLVSFMDLRIYQNEEEARKELVDGLYSDFMIATAKNYLRTCSPNAILFTNGDNDTYPLLYVQAQYNFRPDVMVINYSMLQDPRYVAHLRDSVLKAPGLPLNLTQQEIAAEHRTALLVQKSDSSLELSDVIQFVKNEQNTKMNVGKSYAYIPGNRFKISGQGDEMQWKIDGYFMQRNQLVFLDFLSSNEWHRPIFFANTLSPNAHIGLSAFLRSEGLAYRLFSHKYQASFGLWYPINTKGMFDNLVHEYEWKIPSDLQYSERLMALAQRSMFHQLARALINKGELDSAKLVLRTCMRYFPDEVLYVDQYMINVVEDLYEVGEFEMANEMALKIIENEQNDRNNYAGIRLVVIGPESQQATALARIQKLAKKYGQSEFWEKLKR